MTALTIEKVTDWSSDDWKLVEFTASIEITTYSRGRSAANIIGYDKSENSEYTIFLTDYFDMMLNGDIKDNIISGVFIIKKRGRNFGVKLKSTPKKVEHKDIRLALRPIPEYV